MRLNRDEVQVWKIALDLPDPQLERLRNVLDGEEKSRAARFHFERDRRRFIAARGFLRVVLAGYIETASPALRFSYNEFGKPDLQGEGAVRDFKFNLSHSGGLALIAVARSREVGVDLEFVDTSVDAEAIAEHFFSPVEIATLKALPQAHRIAGFFNCWTRKEAYIKARGMGLSIPLDTFNVSLTPGAPGDLIGARGDSGAQAWKIENLDVDREFTAALAAAGSDWKVLQITRQPDLTGLD